MSDLAKEQELGINSRLISQEPPVFQFDAYLPTWKVVRATRFASAIGPSGLPYIVYKRRTGILQKLWKIIRVLWRRGRIMDQWIFEGRRIKFDGPISLHFSVEHRE